MGLLEKAEQEYTERQEAEDRRLLERHNKKADEAAAYFENTWQVHTEPGDWLPSPKLRDDDSADHFVQTIMDGYNIRYSRKEPSGMSGARGSPKCQVLLPDAWHGFWNLAEFYRLIKKYDDRDHDLGINPADVARAQQDLISTEAQLSGKLPSRPRKPRRTILEWLRG